MRYCTGTAIKFLGSPYSQLPFGISIALVQRQYHRFRQLRSFPNFHSRLYTRCTKPGCLLGGCAQCVYRTKRSIAFLDFPYPQLPFDKNIAFMQSRYHCFRQLRILPNFHSRPYTRCMKPGYLPAVTPSAFIAPRQQLHFWVLNTFSYFLI